jgi:hypothetical protein
MKAVTVSCFGDDPRQVGKDVGAELRASLAGDPDVVLLFCAAGHDAAAVLAGVYERLGASVRVVGCSSCAEINSEGAMTGSVTAMGILLGEVGVTIAHAQARDADSDSRSVGRRLGEALAHAEPALVLLFVDGIVLDSTPVLEGIQAVLGDRLPIVGGVAADDLAFVHTEEYVDREVLTGAAVALAFTGPLRIESVVAGGWQALGEGRKITRVDGAKTIVELDGEPALDVYRQYLGTFGRDLDNAGLEFPFGVTALAVDAPGPGDMFVRAVQGAAADGRGVRVSGDIVAGATVRMMRGSREELIASAAAETAAAVAAYPEPAFALIFDCAGRKVVLGTRYQEEIAGAFARLPPGLPKVGFFTYGELAPHAGRSIHHDETFTAVLIGTRPSERSV